ncbi:MAG: aminopeptidase [Candidatus Lokiarchaeota archaeon]|nr:aminopeptidase [Candidatus Lokiarchaeota archaeon]
MPSEFEQNLEKYAEVILKVGVNLQKGQRLMVIQATFASFPLELATFVEIIVKKAYQLGARFVEVLWDHPQIHLIRFQHAPRDSFEEHPIWRTSAALEFVEKGDAILGILASNPDLFIEQDPELMDINRRTILKHSKHVNKLISKNATNWAVIAAPVDGWTDKIFPNLAPDKRKAKLWDTIFDICRVNQKDPISAWKDHNNQLHARMKFLNNKQYSILKLKGPGTDLVIGLPRKHIWIGGSEVSQNGIEFTANLPTEEIFTLPHKDKTEGVVTATKPLSYGGSRIEDFKLKFSEGKVIEATAGKGQKFLDQFIKTDEGASYLGEIALVPHSSPISQSGLIFYNILIDENASCHIALGRAYSPCLENGEQMSDEGFMNAGGNMSIMHVDLMIGSGEMNVDGILENGIAEPIMRNGEWAFDV